MQSTVIPNSISGLLLFVASIQLLLPPNITSVAMAQEPLSRKGSNVRKVGKVTAISNDTLTFDSKDGHTTVSIIGANVFQLPPGSTDVSLSQGAGLSDIAVGDKIMVFGKLGDHGFAATMIFLIRMTPAYKYVPVSVGKNVQKWTSVSLIPEKIQPCMNNASVGYKNDQCLVIINRDFPINPPTLLMPGGTTVYVRLDEAHWDETIAFNNAVVHTAPEDVSADVLKSLTTPLGGFVGTTINTGNRLWEQLQPQSPDVTNEDQIKALQKNARASLSIATNQLQDSATALTCFEVSRGIIEENGKKICDATAPLKSESLQAAYENLKITIKNNLDVHLPAGELAAADTLLKAQFTDCAKKASPLNEDCLLKNDIYQKTEANLNNTLTYLQGVQNTLLQAKLVLENWPAFHNQVSQAFMTTLEKNSTGTITIAGTEVVTKTSTTIATITLNTTTIKHFVLSTGIMFTSTPYKTYTVGPKVSNGQVDTQPRLTRSSKVTATLELWHL